MNTKLFIKNLQKRSVSALRQYPLQSLSLAAILILLVGVLVTSMFIPLRTHGQTILQENAVAKPALGNAGNILNLGTSVADVVERVSPAVVTVRADRKLSRSNASNPLADNPALRQFFGGKLPGADEGPQVEHGLGSGVIIESNGIILTNNHVVEGATTVKVDLPDKRTFTAKVVGTDAASDLAVLKIEAENLTVLPLGDSDKIRVGDFVLAIGNPLGLRQTVTSGIISAKGRRTGLSDGSFEDFLQTDAPINQGNSGGALVNLAGELVGINSQILSPSGGNIGIGFSIPSNMAKSVMVQLLKDGKVHRGKLGVGIQDVTSELAGNFGLKDVKGVIVNSVEPGSPASASLKQGDVILSFNGVKIEDGNELRNRIAQTAPKTEVTLGYLRDGKELNAKFILGESEPKKEGEDDTKDAAVDGDHGKLGLQMQTLTPQLAQEMGLKDVSAGLVVVGVQTGSPADDAGIQQGDVLLQINRRDVKSVEDVKSAMETGNGSVLLLINRGGRTIYVTAKIK